jgi:hypothetical protein
MDWIDLPQNITIWRAVDKAVMNLRVPQNAENVLTEDLLASKEGPRSMEFVS